VATPTPTPTPSTTPPPAASAPPNGSLEEGVDSPTSWILETTEDRGSGGNWEWDISTAAAGTHSARLTVLGSEDQKSPYLRSAPFELAPDTDYDFSAWTKSAGIDGFYGAFVWVVELDADGNVLKNPLGWSVQHAIKAGEGTTDWVKGTTTFRTDPRCAGGSIYANIYRAHGTFWVDDFRVEKSATPPSASASSR
jgi:hypothetical protein